jgi:hypothetical protein
MDPESRFCAWLIGSTLSSSNRGIARESIPIRLCSVESAVSYN